MKLINHLKALVNMRNCLSLLCGSIAMASGGTACAAEWRAPEPYRAVLEVSGGGVAPNSIVNAPLDFGVLINAMGSGETFSQYSLRVVALDGRNPGKALPHRFDHMAGGSVGSRGKLVFCVPGGGASQFAVYFGASASDPNKPPPPPLIGDGDQLRLRGTGVTSLAAPGLYPVVSDYDGDGRRDLVGSDRYGTGARVLWWRNVGTDRRPAAARIRMPS